MRQTLTDAVLQERFDRAGYVLVPMLSSEGVDALLAAVDELRPADRFDPATSPHSSVTYHCSFLDADLAYKRRTQELVGRTFQPFLDRYLAGYRVLSCNFYVKPPGTGEFTIHQNWPCITDLGDTTVTIWCPLLDVEESNGALQVIEGSHKILPHIEAPGATAYFHDITDTLIERHLRPIAMRAGQGIIFDDSLVHWSARNDSGQRRIAIQITCIPIDATPAFYFRESDHQFELIAADSNFYLEQSFGDLLVRAPTWRSLGYVPNRNRTIDADEFTFLLAHGEEIRASGPAGWHPGPAGPVRPSGPRGRVRQLLARVGR